MSAFSLWLFWLQYRITSGELCIVCKQTGVYVCLQIVAYNKMDVPDSSDYWPDIQQSLKAAGVASHSMCPISAVTGQGVLDLIRMVHTALDELPSEVATLTGCPARWQARVGLPLACAGFFSCHGCVWIVSVAPQAVKV